jgi:hypothetical protein
MMRAPTKESGETRLSDVLLTDPQEQKIRESLEAVGVDADAVMVDTGLGEWPLLEGLPLLAARCELTARMRRVSGPPSKAAQTFDHTIELCNRLLHRLDDPWSYHRIDPDIHDLQFPHLSSIVVPTRDNLKALAAELERCRETLVAMDGRRDPRELHIRFWKALRQVWEANIREDTRWTNDQLASFVIACSEPFFAEATTDGAITAFIERPNQ